MTKSRGTLRGVPCFASWTRAPRHLEHEVSKKQTEYRGTLVGGLTVHEIREIDVEPSSRGVVIRKELIVNEGKTECVRDDDHDSLRRLSAWSLRDVCAQTVDDFDGAGGCAKALFTRITVGARHRIQIWKEERNTATEEAQSACPRAMPHML